MAHNYVSGHLNPVKFTPTSGSEVTLNITSWDENTEVTRLIVTNSGTSGLTARIGGVKDAKGKVTAFLDLDAFPWASNVIEIGTRGVMKFYVSPTKYESIPVLIAMIHTRSAVQEAVSYDFDWEMDGLSGSWTRAS